MNLDPGVIPSPMEAINAMLSLSSAAIRLTGVDKAFTAITREVEPIISDVIDNACYGISCVLVPPTKTSKGFMIPNKTE